MKHLFLILAAVFGVVSSSRAQSPQILPNLPSATTLQDGDLTFVYQAGDPLRYHAATMLQVKTYASAGGGTLTIGTNLAALGVTVSGGTLEITYPANTPHGLVVLDGGGALPAVDGSNLTGAAYGLTAGYAGNASVANLTEQTVAGFFDNGTGYGAGVDYALAFAPNTNNGLVQLDADGYILLDVIGGFDVGVIEFEDGAGTITTEGGIGLATTGYFPTDGTWVMAYNSDGYNGQPAMVPTSFPVLGATFDATVLAAVPNPVTGANGLLQLDDNGYVPVGLLGNDIGATVEAWSANLDNLSTATFDASVLAAVPYPTNTANGLLQFDGGGTSYYSDGEPLSDSYGTLYLSQEGGGLVDATGYPGPGALVSLSGTAVTWAPFNGPNGIPLYDDGGTLDDSAGTPLCDNAGNRYSNLPAGSLILSGGTGSPTVPASDQSTAPTNTVTPVGWMQVTDPVHGTVWIPEYQ